MEPVLNVTEFVTKTRSVVYKHLVLLAHKELVFLEKTIIAMVIREIKFISGQEIF